MIMDANGEGGPRLGLPIRPRLSECCKPRRRGSAPCAVVCVVWTPTAPACGADDGGFGNDLSISKSFEEAARTQRNSRAEVRRSSHLQASSEQLHAGLASG